MGGFFPSWPSNGDYGDVGIIVLIFGADVCASRSREEEGKEKTSESCILNTFLNINLLNTSDFWILFLHSYPPWPFAI